MLAIRLRRTGGKKNAHYRVVVTERSAGRDGRFLEILGHYHPRQRPMEVTFDFDRTEEWLAKGARMSDTVRSLYRTAKAGGEVSEAPEAAVELEGAAATEAAEEGAAEAPAAAATAEETPADEDSADADGEEE